ILSDACIPCVVQFGTTLHIGDLLLRCNNNVISGRNFLLLSDVIHNEFSYKTDLSAGKYSKNCIKPPKRRINENHLYAEHFTFSYWKPTGLSMVLYTLNAG
ncbi:hypothetical protein Bhyg_13626, partial [Pseudolycoriella hygida]